MTKILKQKPKLNLDSRLISDLGFSNDQRKVLSALYDADRLQNLELVAVDFFPKNPEDTPTNNNPRLDLIYTAEFTPCKKDSAMELRDYLNDVLPEDYRFLGDSYHNICCSGGRFERVRIDLANIMYNRAYTLDNREGPVIKLNFLRGLRRTETNSGALANEIELFVTFRPATENNGGK